MRQAGRHIKEYRDLVQKYPTFRQRSEIPEVAVEVSLQPWRNYKTDGCILFSDILTPLPGMGAQFEVDEKKGPIMASPIKTYDDLRTVSLKLKCERMSCNTGKFIRNLMHLFSSNQYLAPQNRPIREYTLCCRNS